MQNKASVGKRETSGIRPLVNYFLCSLQVHHLPSSSSEAWDATERGQGQVILWMLWWYQPLWTTSWSFYIARATRRPICVEEEGNTEAKRQWGLGNISCKRFNLGCVLQPGEKSKLPDGTLVTILSSLPV